jgi:hypothetical protein
MGFLPRTRPWRKVIGLLEDGAAADQLSAATYQAAKGGLKTAAQDVALVHSFWLLTQIPLAAHKENFAQELQGRGLNVSNKPTLLEIASAFSDTVERYARRHGGRTDLGEMAQLAATESLTALSSEKTPTLFGVTASAVQKSLGKFSTEQRFGVLARDFFARLTRRYLMYFLSRELPKHVGEKRRFHNIEDHTEFVQALETHCVQTSLIVERFAGEWFSKTEYVSGITEERAKGFVYVAMKKLGAELAMREEGGHGQ